MLVPDFESKLLLDIHDRLLPWPDQWKQLEHYLHERAAMVRYGVMRCPSWFQEELNRLDSRLRAWWDSWNEKWVIDRLQDEGIVERLQRAAREEGDTATANAMKQEATGLLEKGAFYLTVLQFTPTPTLQLDRQLLNLLRSSDMQRFESPRAFMAEKQKAAEATQKQNEQASTNKVLEAVDKMSSKQIEQFIAVETAIQTGDTITAHGSDAKYLEQARKDKARILKDAEAKGEQISLDTGDRSMNPGMHPRIYKRRRKEL